jgi:anti-anti-sigma factor
MDGGSGIVERLDDDCGRIETRLGCEIGEVAAGEIQVQVGTCMTPGRMVFSCMQVLTSLLKVRNVVSLPDDSAIVFSLQKPVTASALDALRNGVADAVGGGVRAIVVDIDDIGVLDTTVISTLVGLLRDAGTRGASVALRAGRKRILDTLRVTALDKVFTIDVIEERTPARPAKSARAKVGRFVAALATGAFALSALLGTPASAQIEPSPQELVRAVIAQNAEMRSYQAQVSVDFKLWSFPYVSQHLDGTSYFKRPDYFEVVFEKVPAYAKGFDKLYSDIGDPTGWAKRFDLSFDGTRSVAGHHDVIVRLVQKVRGQIDHEDVAIDPVAGRIDAMSWSYYNGGTISMTQEFQQVGMFTVLAEQHATIKIPFVHASADAVYRNYRTNVAIDDSVFTRNKHE